jgi:multisubunit Na+/H+ antiporter MnhE subunit
MTGLAVAIVGGLVWIGLRGSADPATFLVGAAISAAAAWITRLPWRGRLSATRLVRGAAIVALVLAHFVADLATANVRQLRIVLGPQVAVRPRWVRFATTLEQPWAQVIMGVLISLTPGTVTQELRAGEFVIHVLDADPDEDLVTPIRTRIEAPLRRLEAL